MQVALSGERRKLITEGKLEVSPTAATAGVAWPQWDSGLEEKQSVHAHLALWTEAAFVWTFPLLAPKEDWKSYHDLGRALEERSPGISAALLLSLWALQDDVTDISEADGWLRRAAEIARSPETQQLAKALRAAANSKVAQLCRRIFCTHPVATLVEYERWSRAGILDTCRWPLWFAALTVEGAYDDTGKALGTLCWRKNHLRGAGHLSGSNIAPESCKYECVCALCRQPGHGAFTCPCLAAVEKELGQMGSSRQALDELLLDWFQPPPSWEDTFAKWSQHISLPHDNRESQTDFAVLNATLESVQPSTFGEGIHTAKMQEKPGYLPKRSVLIRTFEDLPEFRRTLMNLTYLQRTPKHIGQQHIVHFFGTLTHEGKQVLVFENCQVTLQEYLGRSGKTDEELGARLADEIAMGLRFINENFSTQVGLKWPADGDVWLKICGDEIVAKLPLGLIQPHQAAFENIPSARRSNKPLDDLRLSCVTFERAMAAERDDLLLEDLDDDSPLLLAPPPRGWLFWSLSTPLSTEPSSTVTTLELRDFPRTAELQESAIADLEQALKRIRPLWVILPPSAYAKYSDRAASHIRRLIDGEGSAAVFVIDGPLFGRLKVTEGVVLSRLVWLQCWQLVGLQKMGLRVDERQVQEIAATHYAFWIHRGFAALC